MSPVLGMVRTSSAISQYQLPESFSEIKAERASLMLVPQVKAPHALQVGAKLFIRVTQPCSPPQPPLPSTPVSHLAGSSPTALLPSQASPSPTWLARSAHATPLSRTSFPSPGPAWLSKLSTPALKTAWPTQEVGAPLLCSQSPCVS